MYKPKIKPYEIMPAPEGIDPGWWRMNEENNALLVDNVNLRDERDQLRDELKHPAIEFIRQAHSEGRIVTKLVPPEEAPDNKPRYAGFYCQDYDGPLLT